MTRRSRPGHNYSRWTVGVGWGFNAAGVDAGRLLRGSIPPARGMCPYALNILRGAPLGGGGGKVSVRGAVESPAVARPTVVSGRNAA